MLTANRQRLAQLQSEICKILSNPKRMQILHVLRKGEMTVNEIAESTGLRQANVSQHLALMRHQKIVVERRVGNEVHYRTADPRINDACDIMQAVLLDQANEDSKLVRLATISSRH